MPPSLLRSQFEALEEPTAEEPAIRVEITGTPQQTTDRIIERLRLEAEAEGLTT